MTPLFPEHALSRRQIIAGAFALTLNIAVAANPEELKKDTIILWPELKLISGATLRQDDWLNTPAVVVFWEPWCPYCKRQNSHVDQLYQATLGQKIRIIGVTSETDEAKVKAYIQFNQLRFPVAMVDAQFRTQFTNRQVVPLTCLVSSSGRLIQVIPGEMAHEDVLSLAGKLL